MRGASNLERPQAPRPLAGLGEERANALDNLFLLLGVFVAGAACDDEDSTTDEDATATVDGVTDTPPPPPPPTDTQPPPRLPTETPLPPPPPTDTPTTNGANCHPSYEGACLEMGIGDWDLDRAGGGNGPNYVEDETSGPVQVVGPDDFDLDRDGE